MAVLTDSDIRKLAASGQLISGEFSDKCVQPASYDLRLGKNVYSTATGRFSTLRDDSDRLEIPPGGFVLVTSFEELSLPVNVRGRVGLRARHSLAGFVNLSGPQIDPGFCGNLVLGIVNLGPRKREIRFKDPIFTVEFDRLSKAPTAKYVGQFQNVDGIPTHLTDAISDSALDSIPNISIRLATLETVLSRRLLEVETAQKTIWNVALYVLLPLIVTILGGVAVNYVQRPASPAVESNSTSTPRMPEPTPVIKSHESDAAKSK